MHGRRIYHARGKVLGGSSSINGMIFQRGNPLDYERWAADPGLESWDYAHCLPYFKRMETCLAGADDYRGGGGPLDARARPGDDPALRRVLRGGAAGRLRADRRRQRLPAGGLREVRPQRSTAAAGSARRARISTRCSTGRTSRCAAARSSSASSSRGRARSASQVGGRDDPRERGDPLRRRDQLAAAAAALRASATPASWRRSASPSCTTCPASARTCRTTSRCTCSTRARSRSRCSPR